MSEGFEVLVQLVMAAITTDPLEKLNASPLLRTGTTLTGVPSTTFVNDDFAWRRGTRSCGRFGPATAASTLPRSSSSVSLKSGVGVSSVRKSICSLQYA